MHYLCKKSLMYFPDTYKPNKDKVLMKIEEKILLAELKKKNLQVFENFFNEYYPVLSRYAEGFVFDRQVCEDIVQDFFISFWQNVTKIEIETSIKVYFFTSIKNRCLNYIRDLHLRDKKKLPSTPKYSFPTCQIQFQVK